MTVRPVRRTVLTQDIGVTATILRQLQTEKVASAPIRCITDARKVLIVGSLSALHSHYSVVDAAPLTVTQKVEAVLATPLSVVHEIKAECSTPLTIDVSESVRHEVNAGELDSATRSERIASLRAMIDLIDSL